MNIFLLYATGGLLLSPPLKTQTKVAAVQRFSFALLWMVVIGIQHVKLNMEIAHQGTYTYSSRYLHI
jgi:hypothetical protein